MTAERQEGLKIIICPNRLAIYSLDQFPSAPWMPRQASDFFGLIHANGTYTLVVEEGKTKWDGKMEKGWRALMIEGPLDFSLVGVLAPVLQVLAHAQIPVFSISTYDTDFILVKDAQLENAVNALTRSGIQVDFGESG